MIILAPATVLESLVSRTAGQTESEVVAPVARVAVAAVGNSGEIVAVPATATAAAVGGGGDQWRWQCSTASEMDYR